MSDAMLDPCPPASAWLSAETSPFLEFSIYFFGKDSISFMPE